MKKTLTYLCLGLCGVGICLVFANSSVPFGKKHKPKVPDVTLIGHVVMADGIGRQTAELASFIKDSFKVQVIANHVNLTDVPKAVQSMINRRYSKMGKVVICEESLVAPGMQLDNFFPTTVEDGQVRIAYSMLESSRIPQEWVMQLNLYFDAVAVPDPFLVEVYQKSGVTIPIFELPLGLDLSSFLSRPLKDKKGSPMVFGNLSTCIDRKNQLNLIRAFAKAFGNRQDVVLKINSRGGAPDTVKAIQKEIVDLNCDNIHFTEVVLKKDAYLKFFESIDCYVSLSKGEGFSIQPREAMALGIPVIATNNTGQSTICNSGLVKTIASEILEPAYYFNSPFKSGYRFNCEVDSVANAMKDIYLNYSSYLEKGEAARQWASQYNYLEGNLLKKYKSLIYPKKVILGERNELTEEYLMTSSEVLAAKYQKIIEEWDSLGTVKQNEEKTKMKKKMRTNLSFAF